MLVGAGDHQHVVAGHPHVAAEDVGGHAETGHVADVARAVGVRPGDGGQDFAHGASLVRRAIRLPAAGAATRRWGRWRLLTTYGVIVESLPVTARSSWLATATRSARQRRGQGLRVLLEPARRTRRSRGCRGRDVLAVRVDGAQVAKQELLDCRPGEVLHRAALQRLSRRSWSASPAIGEGELRELLTDAWRTKAPKTSS